MSRCAPPLTGRQGKCVLPDKEFRFALLLARDSSALAWTGFTPAGRSFLPTSACRHAARTISCLHGRPRRVVSEGSALSSDFPADCPHRSPCHCPRASSAGYSEFPAYSQVLLRQRSFHLRTVLDCYSPTTVQIAERLGHFCPTLTVARENGLSHPAGCSASEFGV